MKIDVSVVALSSISGDMTIMLERPQAYEKAPGQMTEPGRVGTWYVPADGIQLEKTDWNPSDWVMTRRDRFVRVPVYRYRVPSTDPRVMAAACVRLGALAVAQVLAARLAVTELRIFQSDVIPTTDQTGLWVFLGLAFCIKDE